MRYCRENSGLVSVDDSLTSFLSSMEPVNRTIILPIEEADDRILSKDIVAPMDYPHYDQCILDGYAVLAEDTVDCGTEPIRYLSLTDNDFVAKGLCTVVHTGSVLPPGADAVLRIEDVIIKENRIIPTKEVKKGQWIWGKGAGLSQDDTVYREGMQLKPTDIAMLAKLDIAEVCIYDRPRVLIVPTGNECVRRGQVLEAGFVYEANGLMCALLVKRYGGDPTIHDIVPDNIEKLSDAIRQGLDYDMVVTIGGSSSGERDFMAQVMALTGTVIFHGVALHPGNHMGAGSIRGNNADIPVLFLPGYTESCAVASFTFVDAAVKRLGHRPPSRYSTETCLLTEPVATPNGIRAVRKVHVRDGKARPIKMIGDSAEPGNYAYLTISEDRADLEADRMVEAVYLE